MEKVQLILQLLHPYTFIPTSTVIREMIVLKFVNSHSVLSILCTACKHVQRLPIQWLLLYVITSKAPNLWWNNQVTTSYSRDGCDHQDNNVHIQVSIAYRVTQKYLQILFKSEKDSHSSDFFFQFQKIYEKLSFKFFQGETSY